MKRAQGIAAVGVALFGLGTVVGLIAPGTAGLVPVSVVVDRLGNDYFLVATLALVAVAFALFVLVRRGRTRSGTPVPEPERVPSGPHPGADFDRFVDAHPLLAAPCPGRRNVRNRLRETAIATVQCISSVPRDAARERVNTGSWTDDPEAAAFLAGESAPRRSPIERVGALLRGETPDQRRARRAAAAIVEYAREGEGE